MLRFLLIILLSICAHGFSAQPGPHNSALVIRNFVIHGHTYSFQNSEWLDQQGKEVPGVLHVSHLELKKDLTPKHKTLPLYNPRDFDLTSHVNPGYAYFLPLEIDGKERPDQRLTVTYDSDTMILDFLGLPGGRWITRTMDQIYFKPGHYTIHLGRRDQAIAETPISRAWSDYYLNVGITPETEQKLIELGNLNYVIPRRACKIEKYINPYFQIQYPSATTAVVRAEGMFLHRVLDVYIEWGPLTDLIYEVEFFNGTDWVHNWGLKDIEAYRKGEGDSLVYIRRTVETFSSSNNALRIVEPGWYRVKALKMDMTVEVSPVIFIGMMKKGEMYNSEVLGLNGKGFPHYKRQTDTIQITTPIYPDTLNGKPHYFFRYGHVSNVRLQGGYANPNDFEEAEFKNQISESLLYINDKKYTGTVDIVFTQSTWNVRR